MNRKRNIAVSAVCILLAAALVISTAGTKKAPAEKQSFAMGSPVRITVYGEKNGEALTEEAARKITELDRNYLSHTLSSSAVCALNSERTAETDEFFKGYLERCLSLSEECEGFTLFSGRLKELWKIEDGGFVPTDGEIEKLLPDASRENIKFYGSLASLSGEAQLDLGALGKGTAAEAAVEYLKSQGVKNAVCTVGGTVGVIGAPKGKKAFSVGVRNPFGAQNEYFGTLSITDCYISTSGDYEKYFEADGVRYSHIFDARTGRPVSSELTSVTAAADDGTVSDFLSTAIFILGEEEGMRLAEKYGAQVIIVKKDKTVIVSDGLRDKFTLTDKAFTVIPSFASL